MDQSAQDCEWDLPPLILHPFNQPGDQARLWQSSRLSLYQAGLVPMDDQQENLEAALLEGRYAEFRMICCIGKDLMRWISQCADFTRREERLANSGIIEQSFADMLVNHTPAEVAARFQSWGVVEFRRILRRGIGLAAVFPHPPAYEVLSPDFLIHCYAYGDSLFDCYQGLEPFARLDPARFHFSLYTSHEYSLIIEKGSQQD